MRARDNHFNSNDETVVVEWRGAKLGHYRASAAKKWTTHTVNVKGSGGHDRLVFREVDGSDGSVSEEVLTSSELPKRILSERAVIRTWSRMHRNSVKVTCLSNEKIRNDCSDYLSNYMKSNT